MHKGIHNSMHWSLYTCVYPYMYIRIRSSIHWPCIYMCVSLYSYKDTQHNTLAMYIHVCILICIKGYTKACIGHVYTCVYPYMYIRIHSSIHWPCVYLCVSLYAYKDTHSIHWLCIYMCVTLYAYKDTQQHTLAMYIHAYPSYI